MKTLVLCDRRSADYFEQDLRAWVREIANGQAHDVSFITVTGDELSPCLGCFECWVKTPGLCIMDNDPANTLSAQLIQSDAVILLSEICFGGYSYDIKSFLDRSIPNISPYFEIIAGEMRHKKRYGCYPVTISIGYGDFTSEEAQIFKSLASRNALNMRPRSHAVFMIQNLGDLDVVKKELSTFLSEEVQA